MIWLDRNENQFGPSPACYAALQETPRENLGVYSRDFLRGVKSTLSERLAERYGVAEPQVLLFVRFPEHMIPTLQSKLSESGIAIKFFDEKDLQCCARITIGTPEQNTCLLEILQRCFT